MSTAVPNMVLRRLRNGHHGGCWRALKQMTEQANMASVAA
jgi:hypothetical protein